MRVNILKRLALVCLCIVSALTASAVTQKEMEQARTITAFWYLRYANNGAGYMEDSKMPVTMAELEKILKETERNNLKAFKAVNVPSDYSGWDKGKLVAYWGDTFFSSPGLSAQGKVAKSRVKNKLNAMTVAAPAAAAAPEKPAEQAATPAAPEKTPEAAAPTAPADAAPAAELPSATDIVAEAEKADSTALAIEQTEEEAAPRRKSSSGGTWIYIVALVVLVGVVVWLVIFASKTMQEGNKEKADNDRVPREPDPSVVPMARMSKPVVAAEPEVDASELRARDREIKGLREECMRLGEENGRLQSDLNEARRELEALRGRLRAASAVTAVASAPSQRAEKPARQHEEAAAVVKPRQAEPEAREIYLGRVNPKGLFVRADKRPVPDKSVFVLTTTDGYTGTFRVLQIAEVIERCLDNPDHYLAGGCSAPDILATEDAEQIRTLQAGTAIFEDGCWSMVRKSKIVYE